MKSDLLSIYKCSVKGDFNTNLEYGVRIEKHRPKELTKSRQLPTDKVTRVLIILCTNIKAKVAIKRHHLETFPNLM